MACAKRRRVSQSSMFGLEPVALSRSGGNHHLLGSALAARRRSRSIAFVRFKNCDGDRREER